MASYGGGGGGGSGGMNNRMNNGLESLFAQLRQSTDENQAQSAQQQHLPDLRSQYNPYNVGGPRQSTFYHHQRVDSPAMDDTMDFPPAAPTPPVGPGMFSQHPPGMMMGPPSTGSDNRTADLLNLLKFSNGPGAAQGVGQGVGQQQQPHQSFSEPPTAPPPGQSDLHRESLIRNAHSSSSTHTIHAPAPAAADPSGLLAALMKGKLQDEVVAKPEPQPQPQPQPSAPTSNWNADPPPENTQQYLLNLLNRPKPSQSDAPLSSETTKSSDLTPQSTSESAHDHIPTIDHALADATRDTSNNAVSSVPTGSFDFEPKDSVSSQMKFHPSPVPGRGSQDITPSKSGLFSYSNPFDDLAATTSNRASKASSTASPVIISQGSAVPVQILKKTAPSQTSLDHKRLGSSSSSLENRDHIRRKLEPTPPAQDPIIVNASPSSSHGRDEKPKETVSEAVSDIANQVDKEAQEALARAVDEQAHAKIAKDLQDMMSAANDHDFQAAATLAAQDIKHELDKDENKEALEATLHPEVAKAVKEIVDEAAQGPVADSWESAEAEDEIVVIEETTTPVKVFNFPMKPWISIAVQDSANDTRPVFRDEAILDIARLKKEFDQIDRNLVAASESYMAYGMSKAGGLRVIRQDDGRDAKLFTDTKDRIFNLAVSATPMDQHTTHKEAILGTGISGTAYWVQIKDGEKDNLEDAHPEQHGFALPPTSGQEGGDAPGGVLKTRARATTNHTDFFAVGRGKSINIIWPAFILQRNLIRPGHDRVVDTDRLAQQCSLKINTGKAGKDFTFSQDDSMVVSLDKSGRVKFWDVRALTAVDENSDLRNPMPLHTALEVKEPLMTLTTTPEGEKAWPTSVLLLDKLRPYQKRGALRYMIVGMKQNHTLQLWDLALGKPVQEFNLPHSKESDAVCSVNYHPPSGMIVVGHPTRNSIYFLHLSAPKYTMKNLSQVDYVQRLVAQDSSIPMPESTAVISGMREYSFANKGILRSLSLLQNPSSASDGEEPTLFELYAMHSKGVACLMIKQSELGWDKDNKVVDPVDAVDAGVVKITKLKPPPPQPENQPPAAEENPNPIRLAIRPKDVAPEAPPEPPATTTATRKGADFVTPPKQKDSKEEEATSSTPPERPAEKKGRKKKNAAEKAAAAAAALAEREAASSSQTNGNAPRVVATTSHRPGDSSKSSSGGFSQEAVESRINTMESRIILNISKTFRGEVDDLRRKIDEDMSSREGSFEHRQGQLLNMVSSVLNDNTQTVLAKIIQDELETSVTPTVGDAVTKSVSEQLGNKLNSSVTQSVQREMQKLLPNAINQALQNQQLIKTLTDRMVHSVSRHVEEEIYKSLDDRIIPQFSKTATQAAQAVGKDILVNVNNQFGEIERVRSSDNQKIGELLKLTTRLSETVSTMANAQAQFQAEILRLQTQLQQQPQPQQSTPRQVVQASQGPGSVASSHSHAQSLQAVSAALASQQQQVQPQQHYVSPGPAVGTRPPQQQYAATQNTLITSPPHQQQWAGTGAAAITSPAHQSYLSGSNNSQVLQAINPNVAALQQSQAQQFASPSSQTTSASGQPLAHQQVVFQPTTKDNRERLNAEQTAERVRHYMEDGKWDDAIMGWIQATPKEEEVFRLSLANYNPEFIRNLNPLLLLSVAATVTAKMESTNLLREKLAWTEMVLVTFHQALPTIEGQVREIAPRVMGLLKSRLEHMFMRISSVSPGDPILKNVSQMSQLTVQITSAMRPQAGSPY